MLAPTVIGAVGSVLGGLLGRSKPISAGQNAFSHVGGIMRAAEKYGFNPLTLLGSVGQMGGTPADNSSFGQGVANAAMIVADDLSSRQAQTAKLNAYQTQNQRLQRRLDAVSYRAPVPGVYGGVRQPSDPEVYGNGAGANGAGSGAGGAYPSGSDGSRPDGSVDVPTQSTTTAFVTPNVDASTEVPEGADLEDIGSGLVLDGINQAKADGNLPKNWEQPFYQFGRNVSYGLAVAVDRTHRGVYYGTRAFNPWGEAAKRNAAKLTTQLGADWWKHQPQGAW